MNLYNSCYTVLYGAAHSILLSSIIVCVIYFRSDPVQPPVVTVNSTRFPNVVPFNVFTLSCNASVEPDIHNNNIDLNVTLKRGTGEDCRDVTSVAPGTVQTSNQYHHITQTFSEVNSSVYCYQCRAELSSEELGDTHMSANQTINVTCK